MVGTQLISSAPSDSLPEKALEGTSSGLRSLVIVARRHGMNLSVEQLVHDNLLKTLDLSTGQLMACAAKAGLTAKQIQLSWNGLSELKKALPVILTLKNGSRMILLRVDISKEYERVILQDPNAHEETLLAIDRVRFEDVWTGEVLLVKRNYDIADETKPFSLGLLATLVFRERRIVRDVAICAFMLAIFALGPIVFWRLLSGVISYKAYNTFYVLCVGLAVLVAFETAFGYLRRSLALTLTTRVDVKLSTYMFDKVLSLPVDFFERTQIGKVSHDMSEVWRIRTFLISQLFGTVLDSLVLFVFLPVMFVFSPLLTAIVLAFCGVMITWIVLMLPSYRRKNSALIAAQTERGSFLIQTLQGIRTVKSLALDARQRHIFDVHTAKVAKMSIAEGQASNLIQTVTTPIERMVVSGTLAIGAYIAVVSNNPADVGALFAFMMLSQRVAAPMLQMAQLMRQFDEARAAVGIVGALVNQPEEEGRGGSGVTSKLQGHVEFSNVVFTYKGGMNPALNGVTFEIAQGMTLGVMGRSGSGKTTLTRLLQRLHSNYMGLIKIDGVDVREYDIDHLRGSLGVVLQDNFLFSGTIRENITIAKTDATYEDMVMAARMAGAEEFIDKLPRGYETHIYEGSPNLSGGQRQRLAIARALITNPRLLILDEATSALDAESEAIVNANIERIAHGRTMIIISHRLSSLVRADAILVLERGKVHDIGKHEELLERCDIYSSLWHQQNSHLTPAAPQVRGTPGWRGPSVA